MAKYKVKPLSEAPQKNVFCGKNKYLTVLHHKISMPMHPVIEDDSYFILVDSGTGIFTINGIEFPVRPGTLAWIQCTQVITIEPSLDKTLSFRTLTYEYALINYLMFKSGPSNDRRSVVSGSPIIYPVSESADCIISLFDDFDNINHRHDYGSALVKVSLLGQISMRFSRESALQSSAVMPEHVPLGWIASIYIAMKSHQNIDETKICRELDTDITTLNRELRMVTGMSFGQSLRRNRCISAASYLLCENLPLDYVSVQAGFKSEVTFFRCFKNILGSTPSEYRESTLCSGKNGKVYRGMIMDDRLLAVIEYMYNHVSEPMSINSIAKETFVSPNIIRTLISDAFGVSYKSILGLFRIRCSEPLLASTELRLSDIADIVGFNSVCTFNRMFKTINGITPNAYRISCREGGLKNE